MSYKGTYEGKSLKHYRTKGSRNGYSKDPNYKPIGQPAKGDVPSAARPDGYNERMQTREAWANRMSNMQNNAMAGVRSQKSTSIPSFKRGDYQTAQAQAMEHRRAAEAKVSTAATAGARNQAMQRAKNKTVGTPNRINTAQPNKGDFGKRTSQQQLSEERRIKGSSLPHNTRQESENRRISGSAMPKTASYNKRQAENRRISGSGMTASQIAAKNNQSAAEQRRISGSKLTNTADANRMNAERRRIAGAKDTGAAKALASDARRKAAAASAVRNSRSDIGNAVADAKADAKRLIKKGRKKVRNLLRKFF